MAGFLIGRMCMPYLKVSLFFPLKNLVFIASLERGKVLPIFFYYDKNMYPKPVVASGIPDRK